MKRTEQKWKTHHKKMVAALAAIPKIPREPQAGLQEILGKRERKSTIRLYCPPEHMSMQSR